MISIIEEFFRCLLNANGIGTYVIMLHDLYYSLLSNYDMLEQLQVANLSIGLTSITFGIGLVLSLLVMYNLLKFLFKGVLKICGFN